MIGAPEIEHVIREHSETVAKNNVESAISHLIAILGPKSARQHVINLIDAMGEDE